MIKTVKLTRYYVLFAMVATAIILTAYFVSPNKQTSTPLEEPRRENPSSNVVVGASSSSRTPTKDYQEAMKSVRYPYEGTRDPHSAINKALRRAHERMTSYGALAEVSFLVVDPDDNPVTNAEVRVSFYESVGWSFDSVPTMHDYSGKTDSNGRYNVKSWTYYGMQFGVSKDGFHDSGGKIDFQVYATIQGCRDGKWFQRAPVFVVVLRPEKNPLELPDLQVLPGLDTKEIEEDILFDCFKGDFLPPYGCGEQTNLAFRRNVVVNCSGDRWVELSVRCVNGGFLRMETPVGSRLRNVYEAPETGYENALSFTYEHPDKTKNTIVKKNKEYWILKCFDEKLGKFRYGIVDYIDGVNREITMYYRFNLPENGRNLEWEMRY